MWIIVDGYNLIRQWPELAMLDRADLTAGREALLQALQAYRRTRGHQITVVFDGRERGGGSEGAERVAGFAVRYSRAGETADAVIARLAAEGGAGTVVVSSDRGVREAARRGGAASISSAEFMARLETSRVAAAKGGEEEEERAVKSSKGVARRLPKAQRRLTRQLRGL
jgi:predicted RNA-binding protein with PIN domain